MNMIEMIMIRIKVREGSSEADGLALINPLQVMDIIKVGSQRFKLSLNAWDKNINDFRHYILDDSGLVDYLESIKVDGRVENA